MNMFVTKEGVAELRYLDEQGRVVGEVQDVFNIQDTFPKGLDEQKLFCMKNMGTGLQATFFCLACQVPILSFPNMAVHCGGKMHTKRATAVSSDIQGNDPGGGHGPGLGSGDVNPYHQAWAEAADERLSLVYDWGVANLLLGDDIVDLYDFQQNQKEFPVDFFKQDARTGVQRLFNCLVCGITLSEERLVRAHCVSRDHSKNIEEKKRNVQRTSQSEKSKDIRQLREILEEVEEPAIGLEQITEWWPGSGREREPPVYTCQLCGDWVGWGGDMGRHIMGERHRREQLVSRYPVLEGMIKDMDKVELGERAKEEEIKHQRRYDVIQTMIDSDKYDEFVMRTEGMWRSGAPGRRGRGSFQPRGKFDNGENDPRNWESGPGYGQGSLMNTGSGPDFRQMGQAQSNECFKEYSNSYNPSWNRGRSFQGNPVNQRGIHRGGRGGGYHNQFPDNSVSKGFVINDQNENSEGQCWNQVGDQHQNMNWCDRGRGSWPRPNRLMGRMAPRAQFCGRGFNRGQFGNIDHGQYNNQNFRGQYHNGDGYRGNSRGQTSRECFNQFGNHRGYFVSRGGRGQIYGSNFRGVNRGQNNDSNWDNGCLNTIYNYPPPLMKEMTQSFNPPNQLEPNHVTISNTGEPEKPKEWSHKEEIVSQLSNPIIPPESSHLQGEGESNRYHYDSETRGRARGVDSQSRGFGRGRRSIEGFAGGFTRGGVTERPRGFSRQRGFGRAGAFSNLGLGFGRGSSKSGTSPRRGGRDVNEEDEELPEACYAVSAEQIDNEEKEQPNKKENESKKKRSYTPSPERFPEENYYDYEYYADYDDYYGYNYSEGYGYDEGRDMSDHYRDRYYGNEEEGYRGLHGVRKVGHVGRDYDLSRGNRPDSRYYGPQATKIRRRDAAAADDTPYEGPTIFDKVFRTRKKDDDENCERGEKERDQAMEREWRRYKERTEARIRREKEKLERYERRIKELQGDEEERSSLKDLVRKKKRQRRSLDISPPRAYTNKPAYSSSESDREESPPPPPPPLDSPPTSPAPTPTPPPGTNIAPVLSPTIADSDRAQARFDPY